MTINRPTVTYLVMLAAFFAGMAWILRAGARLQAPPDLRGQWSLVAEDGSAGAPGVLLADGMEVEQSGRFCRIAFSNGLRLDARLTELRVTTDGDETHQVIRAVFDGGEWRLTVAGKRGGDKFALGMEGPQSYSLTATRQSGAPAVRERQQGN